MFGLFAALHRIERKLDALLERTGKMAVDFTNFDAAMGSLSDEMKIVSTDVGKVIDMLAQPDATTQAKIDAASAALSAIKGQAAAIAAAAEAASTPPAPDAVPATG